jgi:hypothetical protein
MAARNTWLGTLLVAVLVAAVGGRAQTRAQAQRGAGFLVVGARVFDGKRVVEDTQVAVEADAIRAVGRDLTMWRHLPAIRRVLQRPLQEDTERNPISPLWAKSPLFRPSRSLTCSLRRVATRGLTF